jgi:hypothetical protein
LAARPITQGNNSFGVNGTFNGQPIILAVRTAAGAPYINAPVKITVGSGGLSLSNAANATTSTTLTLNTDANGNVQFYFKQPDQSSATTTVQVISGASLTNLTSYAYSAAEAANDTDGDGIPNSVETSIGTNASQAAQPGEGILLLSVLTPTR